MGIGKAFKEGNGNTIIYTALLAAMLANCIPTVADGWYFSLQQRWKQQLEDKKITDQEYWWYDVLGYYGITAGYYGILLVGVLALGQTSVSFKSKLLLGIIGGGFVVSVVMKNVQKDEKVAQLKADGTYDPNSNV